MAATACLGREDPCPRGTASSMVAPAMEFRTEGLVAGVGARIFQVAGPVLLYGLGSSFVVGMLAWVGLLLRHR